MNKDNEHQLRGLKETVNKNKNLKIETNFLKIIKVESASKQFQLDEVNKLQTQEAVYLK